MMGFLHHLGRHFNKGVEWSHSVSSLLSWSPKTSPSPSSKTLLLVNGNHEPMDSYVPRIWAARARAVAGELLDVLWVIVIFLSGELVIWGLSFALSPIKIEFFSSIMSMIVVFIVMLLAYLSWQPLEGIYQQFIKPKVDFINAHLGVGFPVPIVMLNENEVLNNEEIARVIGNAVITSIVSWFLVFTFSFIALRSWERCMPCSLDGEDSRGHPKPLHASPPRITLTLHSNESSESNNNNMQDKPSRTPSPEPEACSSTDPESGASEAPSNYQPSYNACRNYWKCLANIWPVLLSVSVIFMIGAPVFAITGDRRALDGFVLWFVWISAVTSQRTFKASQGWSNMRLKTMLATMMNPVLMTTLLMIGYTRLMAGNILDVDLSDILDHFSGGSPLYRLWTAKVTDTILPKNPSGWYGAGDAALSLLECGIFVWGFKLFECRKQLFSAAGLLTIVLSIVAAAGNVFLSVLAARALGLDAPEALAFSARSVTLALAKPAVEAVGGNVVVNAALVVSSGILGQLMYPFTLDRLGVKKISAPVTPSSLSKADESKDAEQKFDRPVPPADDAITVAAGIAIGVNGAAMGVAYLYETKSRAAPYAALSMTVFGVMTVVFTTVSPFKEFLITAAQG